MDPTGLQFQQQLFWTDEALLTGGISSLLIQETQEQLLRELGQHKKKGWQPDAEAACVAVRSRVLFCVLLWGASDYSDLFPGVLSAPVCTVNAIEVIIVGAEGGGVGEGGIILLAISTHPPTGLSS